MITSLVTLAITSLTLAACGSSKDNVGDRCTRGVSHVFELTLQQGASADGKPSAEERAAMEATKKSSLAECEKEGFTQAQLDCVLGATDWNKFLKLGTCTAIKERKPSWLIIP